MSAASARLPAPHAHDVQFHERPETIDAALAAFVREGLAAGEGIVLLASRPRIDALAAALTDAGHDLAALRLSGQVVVRDARETLATFVRGGRPDRALFREAVDAALSACHAPRGIRAFGDMVDVLATDGNLPAAVELEELWNEVCRERSLPLLCGYAMSSFLSADHGDAFAEICRLHARVAPARAPAGDPTALEAELAHLQQQAMSLAAEVERRRRAEVELREALERRARLEEELRRQNEDLRAAVRFSETFVEMLGHDLRNPLSGIVTSAAVLERRADPARTGAAADRIRSSARRMERMIDQILDFTRIRLGDGLRLARGRADLAELFRLAARELEDPARLVLRASGDTAGSWDAERLVQVLGTLAGNALTHGEPGSPVTVSLDGGATDAVVVTVHNRGAVPDSLLPSLFEVLRGGRDHKQARSSGLGLGLHISRHIVEAHGGTIDVTSTPADGTTVVVRLPRA